MDQISHQPQEHSTHAPGKSEFHKLTKFLPIMVKHELQKLPEHKQHAFMEEYKRGYRTNLVAYILWCVLGLHYAYFGKWGYQIAFWISGIVTVGIVAVVWMIIDLFRIPHMVLDYNKDLSIKILRDMKTVSS